MLSFFSLHHSHSSTSIMCRLNLGQESPSLIFNL
ncbi:hypothetical protein OROGR_002530 [Orobanche gracilis]